MRMMSSRAFLEALESSTFHRLMIILATYIAVWPLVANVLLPNSRHRDLSYLNRLGSLIRNTILGATLGAILLPCFCPNTGQFYSTTQTEGVSIRD